MAYAMRPAGEVFLDTRAEQRLGEARRRFLVVSMCYLDLKVRRPEVSAPVDVQTGRIVRPMRAIAAGGGSRSTPPLVP